MGARAEALYAVHPLPFSRRFTKLVTNVPSDTFCFLDRFCYFFPCAAGVVELGAQKAVTEVTTCRRSPAERDFELDFDSGTVAESPSPRSSGASFIAVHWTGGEGAGVVGYW